MASYQKEELECSVCNVSFTGPESKRQHDEGKLHKKNLLNYQDTQRHKSNTVVKTVQITDAECNICNVKLSGPESRKQHEEGKNHLKRLHISYQKIPVSFEEKSKPKKAEKNCIIS